MSFFKWVQGRQQGVEYYKMKLWSFKISKWGADGYILKYPPNTKLPSHKDPVEGFKHWRVNVSLSGNSVLTVNGPVKRYLWGRIAIFRSDLYFHSVDISTKTFKLSLGFVQKEDSDYPPVRPLWLNQQLRSV